MINIPDTSVRYYETLPSDAISPELEPIIAELGLHENCKQLAEEGWTVLENAASKDFNDQLRKTIIQVTEGQGGFMLLSKDPVFAEAVLNRSLLAMAEFSVGRGFLLSQAAATVRKKDDPGITLHADHNWVPAPFPNHNMLLTACWACDGYTQDGGATLIVPGSNRLRRHPNESEISEIKGAIPIECPPGAIALWDGNLWHANYPRSLDGERVVCHITYTRLMCRPVEDYSQCADNLIEEHGVLMSQLLGREDMLFKQDGADLSKLVSTFNNAKR